MIVRQGNKNVRKVARKATTPQWPEIGDLSRLKLWVLSPKLETGDPNLDYYYDFSQSIAEYEQVFGQHGINWIWQPVTMQNFETVIAGIRKSSGRKVPVVLNLCDGDEVNGTPGVSVIDCLEKHRLIYTGADRFFYDITTSKIPMKRAFDLAGVSTPAWALADRRSVGELLGNVGSPLILKPAVSGGSMGVSVKNVVKGQEDLEARLQEMSEGYRGWNLMADGLIGEQFVVGREFTSMVVGTREPLVLPAIERIFHQSLPEQEKFLSFDRLWEIYEEESAMPDEDNFYEYALAPSELQQALRELTIAAYRSVKGVGYARLDFRMDAATGKLYVLEVNAQCGISEDENFTSIGAILRFADLSFAELVKLIIIDAFERRSIRIA